MEQRIVDFFASGTVGAGKNRENTLEAVIARVNKEGWRVDQIVPTDFRPSQYDQESLNMTKGVILCSKV